MRSNIATNVDEPGKRSRRRVSLVAWGVTLALPAAGAVALWSAGGTGDGAAQARSAVNLEVAAGTTTPDLYPGATGNVVFAVTNPNPYAVSVTSATLTSVTGTTDCPGTNFTLNGSTVTATTIAAGGTATVTATGGITMNSSAGDACQGVTVAVTGSLSGTQV